MIPHYLQIRLTEEEYHIFRKKINAMRKSQGLSIEELAEACGVKPKTMNHFIYGDGNSKFIVASLSNYFKLKQEEIAPLETRNKTVKGSFFGGWSIGIVLAILAVPLTLSAMPKEEVHAKEIDYSKYIVENATDNETEAMGVMPDTDFEPAHYLEELNPYPDAIRLDIEATAYCYGTTTCTGKPVRVGYAAMAKEYIGKTAVVYEADENGEPLDYIGIYEIEDTGGDYRIKNGTCIDIYIPDYDEAISFGRKDVVVYLFDAKG